jgi:drug/metabolite transporter (DMT)-like permease
MIFLILAVVSSTCNHLLFKAFARLRVDLLNAIVVNFGVCVIIGYSSSFESFSIFSQDWYSFSIIQGSLFVVCLLLMGRTTANQGVAVASLATRLSVAIPTVMAFLLYDDLATTAKIIGILAALLALYLSSGDSTGSLDPLRTKSMLPLALFAVFGLYSTWLKFVQARYLGPGTYHTYVMASFLAAFLISGAVLGWRLFRKQQTCKLKDLGWGLVLGCTNYGSVYFLVRTLGVPRWQSSQIFPTVSIAVVGLSSLGAWAFFQERFDRRMLLALGIGVGSIVLVNL